MQRSYNKGFNFDVRNGFEVMQQSHAFSSKVANFHVSFLLPTIYAICCYKTYPVEGTDQLNIVESLDQF